MLIDLGEDLPHGLFTGIMHSLRVRVELFHYSNCNGIYLASATGEVPLSTQVYEWVSANLMLGVIM